MLKFLKIKTKTLALSCALMCSIASMASAHALWVNATDYTPHYKTDVGAKTTIYAGWGHNYPVDSYVNPKDFNETAIVNPSNVKTDFKFETTGFVAKKMVLKEKGIYAVDFKRHSSFNTKYLKNGKEIKLKKDMKNVKNVISSTYSQQFAKSLIKVGEGPSQNATKALGLRLEMVPLENPYDLKVGDKLHVKLLYEGEPATYTKIWAQPAGLGKGNDFFYAASTNGEGIAEIRITDFGPWLLKTGVSLPPKGNLVGRVKLVNYFSSLTFMIP